MSSGQHDGPSLVANLDAERAVLGAILLDNAAYPRAAEVVSPDDFSYDANRRLFAHMAKLAASGKPAGDLVLLTEELAQSGELEAVGGVGYVSDLTAGLPRSVNVAHYAKVVARKAAQRRLIYYLQNALGQAQEPSADVGELQARIVEHLSSSAVSRRGLSFRTAAEMESGSSAAVEWLAPPWVACGVITELLGKIKAGKSSWLLALCSAVVRGAEFMGQQTSKGPVIYLTEQGDPSFRVAMERAGLTGNPDFVFLSWKDIARTPWPNVVREAVAEAKCRGARLLAVDTLPQFAGMVGEAENNSGDALAAIQPLQVAAGEGLGVAVVRHERKSGGDVGDSGRGSSAFGGAVDTILALRRPEGQGRPSMRVIRSLSRFSEVPEEAVIDLTAAGYVSLGTGQEVARREAEDALLDAAPVEESGALTLDELCKEANVKRSTGRRAIVEVLIPHGRLRRRGAGARKDPYRYFRDDSTAPIGIGVGRKEMWE